MAEGYRDATDHDPNAFPRETGGSEGRDEGHAEGGEEGEGRVDWKERAIRAEERARVYSEERNAPQRSGPTERDEPRESKSQALARQVAEAKAALPAYDPSNPQTFWERQNAKDALDEMRAELSETRERERQEQVTVMRYQQQAQTTVQQVKGQLQAHPMYSRIEREFDKTVSRMPPHVAADPNALTLVLKNMLFDEQNRQGSPPPGAPRGDYGSGPASAQPRRRGGKVEWRSDKERAVGELYGMTPEQYYDPAHNEHSDLASGNGINIYGEIGGRR